MGHRDGFAPAAPIGVGEGARTLVIEFCVSQRLHQVSKHVYNIHLGWRNFVQDLEHGANFRGLLSIGHEYRHGSLQENVGDSLVVHLPSFSAQLEPAGEEGDLWKTTKIASIFNIREFEAGPSGGESLNVANVGRAGTKAVRGFAAKTASAVFLGSQASPFQTLSASYIRLDMASHIMSFSAMLGILSILFCAFSTFERANQIGIIKPEIKVQENANISGIRIHTRAHDIRISERNLEKIFRHWRSCEERHARCEIFPPIKGRQSSDPAIFEAREIRPVSSR